MLGNLTRRCTTGGFGTQCDVMGNRSMILHCSWAQMRHGGIAPASEICQEDQKKEKSSELIVSHRHISLLPDLKAVRSGFTSKPHKAIRF